MLIAGLLEDLPIGKLRQLGGKFGDEVQQALSITTVGAHRRHKSRRWDCSAGTVAPLLDAKAVQCQADAALVGILQGSWPGCRAPGWTQPSGRRRSVVTSVHCLQQPSLSAVSPHSPEPVVRTTRSWHAQAGWLARLARGLDDEAVKPRLLPKSVGCSKTFRGRSALTSLKLVHDWLLSIGAPFLRRDSVSHEASSVIMRATHQGE